MQPGTPSVPRWAERFLRWSLAPAERAAVLGDLQEEFETFVEDGRTARARWWYWRQVLSSIGPNALRRARQAWRRRCDTDAARAARAKTLFWAKLFALQAVGDGWLAGGSVHRFDWRQIIGRPPFWLAILYLAGAALATGETREAHERRPGEKVLPEVALVFMMLMAFRSPVWLLVMVGLIGVVLFVLPTATWTRLYSRQVSYSVRIPVPAGRRGSDLLLGTTSVAKAPFSMSGLIIGKSLPLTDEAIGLGVQLLNPSLGREFEANETLRLFAVVNGSPTNVHARVELRAMGSSAPTRSVPVVVRAATAQLPNWRRPDAWYFDPLVAPTSALAELDATIALADVPSGRYVLRLVATDGIQESHQETDLAVRAPHATRGTR